eukprot:GHRR01025847.1.p1 GENE.GHRR01025847.1~~GHRR01025847.1.p1  ORF type:complete len:157 (+),score=44.87 GHRR01025847.1:676-1146(+)
MGSIDPESQGLAVVVGANKGIGLGLCKDLKAAGYDILASCRSSSDELNSLSVKVVQGVDVSKANGLSPLYTAIQQEGREIQLLVVCAGYQKLDSLQDLDFDDLDKHWQINAVGPLRLVKGLLSQMEPGRAKVVLLSSKMGSQGAQDIPPGGGLVSV